MYDTATFGGRKPEIPKFDPGAGDPVGRNGGRDLKLGVFSMRTDRGVAPKLFKKRMVRIGPVVSKLGPKNRTQTFGPHFGQRNVVRFEKFKRQKMRLSEAYTMGVRSGV